MLVTGLEAPWLIAFLGNAPLISQRDDGSILEVLGNGQARLVGTADPFAKFQLNIMASFAQLERAITRERQSEGIRAAKARGVYQGRFPKLMAEQLA